MKKKLFIIPLIAYLAVTGIFYLSPQAKAEIIAREGKGYLERIDGNLVLHLKGSYYEMGYQHGVLLKEKVRENTDMILYGVGFLTTIKNGRWFLFNFCDTYARLSPFIPEKYKEEMKGLAKGAGLSTEEVQYANIFPEFFHCSGFAIFGRSTSDGRLYHGRILDYMVDVGLQEHAVLIVQQPDSAIPFVNASYAGFIGSVTGMNSEHIAVGEMGGGGEGKWDGMPMAFLMREVLERARTLSEGVEIFKKMPRTCEYYYVISDGKIPDARGIATTPEKFETVAPGEPHPQLTLPIEDTVIMSAGERYKELVKRIKDNYGTIDVQKAMDLMKRPVAMKSNLHNVLFTPKTLDLWVANAGTNKEPACDQKYTHYNLGELLSPSLGINR